MLKLNLVMPALLTKTYQDIPYKDRTYGSPLVAMHALFSAMERNGKSLHTDVLLVFEDTNPAYLKSLIGNIKQYCNEKPKIRDGIEYFTNITVNEVDEKNLSCTITNRKKKNLKFTYALFILSFRNLIVTKICLMII